MVQWRLHLSIYRKFTKFPAFSGLTDYFCRAFSFQGIIIGTVFLKVSDNTAAFYSRSGVIYLFVFYSLANTLKLNYIPSALLFSALMAMAEIPALFSQRPIILRHQQWGLYHPFVEAVALTIVELPVTFLSTLVFGGLIYALVGLQKSAEQFL